VRPAVAAAAADYDTDKFEIVKQFANPIKAGGGGDVTSLAICINSQVKPQRESFAMSAGRLKERKKSIGDVKREEHPANIPRGWKVPKAKSTCSFAPPPSLTA